MKKLMLSCLAWNMCLLMSCGQNVPAKNVSTPQDDIVVGGRCEGCEAIYESPAAFDKLSSTATLPDFAGTGPKLEISGIIYHQDGTTPAADVVLYIYHTHQNGIYESKTGTGWERRHGYIRGWLKTGKDGRYKILTLKPAPYPGGKAAAHIHPVVKEEGKSAYWIDEFVFDDDQNVDSSYLRQMQSRGGNGVLQLVREGDYYKSTRNIILGMNIPAYPAENP